MITHKMKTKTFSVFASVFALVLMLNLASAAVTLTGPTPSTVQLTKQGTTFTVTGTPNFDITTSTTTSTLTFTDSNSKTAVFSVSPPSTKTNISSALFNVSSSSIDSSFLVGEYTGTINVNVTENGNSSSTGSLAVPVTFTNTFCKNGQVNATDMELSVDVNNNGQGDDNDWTPLDDIEIKVTLDNNGDVDWDKVNIELGLYKSGSAKNIAGDMIWTSADEEKVEVGNVNSDKSKTHTFQFRVDPSEVSDANYVLVVKAYPKSDEDANCVDSSSDLSDFGSEDFKADISVSQEGDKDKMVVVDTASYPVLSEAFCGETVLFTPDVYNIGDEDFQDQVKVTLYNKELGIDMEDVIVGDLNIGDKATSSFSFKVPEDAAEKQYTLQMETFYDYDSDAETYDESSSEVFNAYLKVAGNCAGSAAATGKASVTAALESGGNAGEGLVVRAVVTNSGSEKATYAINAAGYSGWASSGTVSPSTLTLEKGASGSVLINLDVKDDASGDNTFNIEVVSGSQLVATQPVSVSVQAKTAGGLGGLFTGAITGGNTYLLGLGALNVILIVAIIFVVVRLMRK